MFDLHFYLNFNNYYRNIQLQQKIIDINEASKLILVLNLLYLKFCLGKFLGFLPDNIFCF